MSSTLPSNGPVRLRPQASLFPEPLSEDLSFLTKAPGHRRLKIHHPGYETDDDLLLTLYALDHETGGLHHGFVLTVCTLIAGNAENGFLSLSADETFCGSDVGIDEVLPAGDYYFHVPQSNHDTQCSGPVYRYPIVPTFQDWPFPLKLPHTFRRVAPCEQIHSSASQSSVSAAVRSRDTTCRVSSHSSSTEVAHLCPEHEKEWFLRNSLQQWNLDLSLDTEHVMQDLGNLTLLRKDIHVSFDERKFVFYPKSDNAFHIHMLEPTPDLMPLYHNRQTYDLSQCSMQLLYARLAWAIFPSLSGFLGKPGVVRRLLVSSKDSHGRVTWEETDEMPNERLRARIAASRGRSPKKRQRAADQDLEDHYDRPQDRHSLTTGTDERPIKRRIVDSAVTVTMPMYESSACPPLATPAPSASFESDEDQHQDQNQDRSSTKSLHEWEEDMTFEAKLIGLSAEERPPSFYPGHRRAARMKQDWLERNRPETYHVL